jgi:steroid 5-alpha reductase family enzyme
MKPAEAVTAVLMLASIVILAWLQAGALPWLLASVLVFTVVWLVSLPLRDASIIDAVWGPAQALLVWFSLWWTGTDAGVGGWWVIAAITLWALRLGIYIGVRAHGKPEDYRYAQWRKDYGSAFWWKSWLNIFLLQAVLAWMVVSHAYVAVANGPIPVTLWLWIGLAVWLFGFLFEAIGDWQLSRFKADPDNKGKVMDQGLWGWTRHPNYFGEAVLWWGIFIAIAPGISPWLAIGPLLMTWLVMKVSGVTMLEEGLKERRSGYADYQARVPAFFPKPPALQPKGSD